jgi:hypothetical protein
VLCKDVNVYISNILIIILLVVNKSSIIRLRDGTDKTNGRLEVKISGSSWGTVCDDGFSEVDARVACRQLGLPT